ncbi:MAG TPA: methyltransferase domain-containing protein [Candidatus Angelobacter sp.]|nr:methyltransferase domain-containing protein [Candidatus Angelobacter sp.]
MSTIYQSLPDNPGAISPPERLRKLGQEMGLWNHGFDFARFAQQLFKDIEFRDKAMLEIGCGKGMLCLWAALHGAQTVGLEPLAEGCYDSSDCHKAFKSMAEKLKLPQAAILPLTVQAFDGPKNYFDVVLSVASINHIDEKSCIALRDSPDAAREYRDIFRKIAAMMRPGGKLIIMDAARHNIFGDLGMRNPISPNIEWFKHHQPEFWAELLSGSGFGNPAITWTSGKLLRYARIFSLPKALSYFGQSIFRLELTRIS